jgi:hypothetical protein
VRGSAHTYLQRQESYGKKKESVIFGLKSKVVAEQTDKQAIYIYIQKSASACFAITSKTGKGREGRKGGKKEGWQHADMHDANTEEKKEQKHPQRTHSKRQQQKWREKKNHKKAGPPANIQHLTFHNICNHNEWNTQCSAVFLPNEKKRSKQINKWVAHGHLQTAEKGNEEK